jgi:uncharacterized protein YaiE (UPF0345 family)
MNKTTIIVGGIVIIIAIVGGVMYANRSNINTLGNATTTPITNVGNTTTTTTTSTNQSAQAGLPIVSTNSNAFPTDTTVIVNGNINPEGAFTNYWYEYGLTSNLGIKTVNQTVGSGFVQISAPAYITGLSKNTSYYFRLVGENAYGMVAGAIYTFGTSQTNPPPVGSAPTVKTTNATSISQTTANLNGDVTANKTGTQYWFEYGKTAKLGNTSTFYSAGDGSAKTPVSISLSSLDPWTTYYFRLNAQNQFGTINGSILNFKTTGQSSAKAPSVTTGSATNITSSGAALNGTVTPNLADTKYWFEYSTDSLLGSVLLKSTSPISVGAGGVVIPLSNVITGLNSKTNYYFRIVAQNSFGTVRGEKATFKTN